MTQITKPLSKELADTADKLSRHLDPYIKNHAARLHEIAGRILAMENQIDVILKKLEGAEGMKRCDESQ